MSIPIPVLLKEVRREIATRRHVYPRWVAEQRINQHVADERIAIMEAIADILEEKLPSGRQGSLFDTVKNPWSENE